MVGRACCSPERFSPGVPKQHHFVPMVKGQRTYDGFVMGYMRAMLQRALG